MIGMAAWSVIVNANAIGLRLVMSPATTASVVTEKKSENVCIGRAPILAAAETNSTMAKSLGA